MGDYEITTYKERKEQSSVPVLSHAGCTANNDKDKASMLNNFFSQCFNKELPPLTSHDCLGFTTPDECPESVLCSEEEVAQLLQSIDVSKSNGPDKISGRMLKATALSIAPSITKLFNLSIKLGCVPQTWKLSNVVPVPKSGDRTSLTNYRPSYFYNSFALRTIPTWNILPTTLVTNPSISHYKSSLRMHILY